MFKFPWRVISVAAATIVLTAGCASQGSKKDASVFPTGKYRNGDTVAIFNADGTFVGTTTDGKDWVKGTYSHTSNELKLVDTWEGDTLQDKTAKRCVGLVGHYGWKMAGDVFTANVIDDPCEGRRKGTDGVAWTRML